MQYGSGVSSGSLLPKRNDVVLLIRGIAAIAVFVFLAIVEMTRIALQETQRRLIWREAGARPIKTDQTPGPNHRKN
jgi:hypothetical protein